MKRNRCVWREDQYMLHLLQQTLTPRVSMRESVENWHGISLFLRESSRNRRPQLATLGDALS